MVLYSMKWWVPRCLHLCACPVGAKGPDWALVRQAVLARPSRPQATAPPATATDAAKPSASTGGSKGSGSKGGGKQPQKQQQDASSSGGGSSAPASPLVTADSWGLVSSTGGRVL